MNNRSQEKIEKSRLYNAPENRPLRYAAWIIICIVIIIMLSIIIFFDDISYKWMLILRGCAGLGAIAYVAVVGILVYRVNKQYFQNHRHK